MTSESSVAGHTPGPAEPEAVTVEELARAIEGRWYAASPFNRSKAAADYILSRFDVRRR